MIETAHADDTQQQVFLPFLSFHCLHPGPPTASPHLSPPAHRWRSLWLLFFSTCGGTPEVLCSGEKVSNAKTITFIWTKPPSLIITQRQTEYPAAGVCRGLRLHGSIDCFFFCLFFNYQANVDCREDASARSTIIVNWLKMTPSPCYCVSLTARPLCAHCSEVTV